MLKTIETEILVPIEEKKGYVRYVGQRKAKEVFDELQNTLKEMNLYPDEYFLLANAFQFDGVLFPKMADLHCYAQWGSSEGVYLEVDILTSDEEKKEYKTVHFATGKTLEETEAAFDRMQYIAGCIYKVFMGSGYTPARYVILKDEDAQKTITYEKLVGKLEQECKDIMREHLLHKEEGLSKIAGELGLKLQILNVLKKEEVFKMLPDEKLKELYETDGIMQHLYQLVHHICEADEWEIEDAIAAAPTLLQMSTKR